MGGERRYTEDMYTHPPPAICCNVSVFLSGNIANDNANVTAFLAVLVIPLTNEQRSKNNEQGTKMHGKGYR